MQSALLLVALLSFSWAQEDAEVRKSKLPYIADAVGNTIPPPSNGPATVGSPTDLLTPDKYEFYTFDESGELVKRLMTLEEIQAIVAAGEGADGHLVTFANDDQPPMAFNYSQPPPNKINSVLTNVQNVLLAQMEAQKNNPPSHAPLDTPDVSDSWSLILPSIFGNKGVDIVPDKTSSPFSTPETETIELDKPVLTDLILDDNTLSKEGNDQINSLMSTTKIITTNTDDIELKTEEFSTEKISTIADLTTKGSNYIKTTDATSTTNKPINLTTSKIVTTTIKPVTTTIKQPVKATTVQSKITTSKVKYTTKRPSTQYFDNQNKNESDFMKINSSSSTKFTTTTRKISTTTENLLNSNKELFSTSAPLLTSSLAHSSMNVFIASQTPVQISKTPFVSSTNKQHVLTTPLPKISTSPSTEINEPSFVTIQVISPSSISSNLSNQDFDQTDTGSNTTTLTTQSVSPSTTVSTTQFMHLNKNEYTKVPLQVTTSVTNNPTNSPQTISNDQDIPLFDVAQSISQIASDLGSNFPIPTTSNLLDLTKDNNLELESKESVEIDIPETNKAPNESKTEKTDDFVRISTIDPATIFEISKISGNKSSFTTTSTSEISLTTDFVTSTTIDPILSGSMEDLLSQVVNQSPQTIHQSSEKNAEPITLIETSTSTPTYVMSGEKLSTVSSLNVKSDPKDQKRNVTSLENAPMSKIENQKVNTGTVSPILENKTHNTNQSVNQVIENSLPNYNNSRIETNDLSKIISNDSNHVEHNFNKAINATNEDNEKDDDHFIRINAITTVKSNTSVGTVATTTTVRNIESTTNSHIESTTLNKTENLNNDSSDKKNSSFIFNNEDILNKNVTENKTPETFSESLANNSKSKYDKGSVLSFDVTENNKIQVNVPTASILNKNITNTKNLNKENSNFTEIMKVEELKKKIQKVNIDDKEFSNNSKNVSWKLISTVSPPKANEIPKDKTKADNHHSSEAHTQHEDIVLDVLKENQGLEVTTKDLNDDVLQFTKLCNELAFRYWNAAIENIDKRRSFVLSPYSITSMLAMMFMGARGSTSGEMNEILKLDDMVTFNPHFILKNISDSIIASLDSGVVVSAFVRELYSDRNRGRILTFYKERSQHFYNGHVEEINFKLINDIIRRRTNLLVKRHTWGKITEYMKTNSITMNPPLAAFSANIFQTDCSGSSVEGRDGEMYFVVSPNVRQRRLVPVPAVVYKKGFLAGYDPVLDATAASLGTTNAIVSTLFLMPGQQGNVVHGDDLEVLEKKLLDSNPTIPAWNRLLRTLLPRIGLELQIPRFSHKSIFNISSTLKRMGLKDIFDPDQADLAGLNGPSKDLYLSDMIQSSTIVTCGEGLVGEEHHVEEYPDSLDVMRRRRTSRWMGDWDEPRDYQRAFHDPHDLGDAMYLPLHLRPRQARLPARDAQPARLKFDRPFLFFVRHNPTGMILYVGRYNPRLLP
ncbi:Leukocyte elastase inhibitor [Eumeta japonica]|uniref:Leukocyte elastase inhibitor n=1 Tax=Eumeta variegata TaxID=151549 RepID=A0A4C1U036_EUMVA|nr:Leukocyte elastase inhibitor [Eumeta japonica]